MLALREIKRRESGARRRIFRFELNRRFELLASVVGALLVLVESAPRYILGIDGVGIERLRFLEVSFRFGVSAPFLLQQRQVHVSAC